MNKKKSKLSITFITTIALFSILIVYLSYRFYSNSVDSKLVTKVNSTDMLSIDSIKRISVEDTVKYFTIKVNILKNEISEKDSLLRLNKTEVHKVLKIKDSIYARLESTRLRLKQKDSLLNLK